ncbi:MAG: CHAT domain-containing protein/Tfp pilus assembly protein PilF [Paraglaciecola sp.]|jgi:CHAT domain-containing protein/Tfp pilus assembly protein PilF
MIRFYLLLVLSLYLKTTGVSQIPFSTAVNTQFFQETKKLVNQAKYSLALTEYGNASSLFKEKEDWENFFKSQVGEIDCYLKLKNNEKELSKIKAIEEDCARKLGDNHPVLARLYYWDAIIDQTRRNGQQVDMLLHKALAIFMLTEETQVDVAKCYNVLGNYWMGKKDYDKALVYHNQSLKIKKAVLGNTDSSLGINYNNIGVVYQQLGEHGKAIDFYERALVIKIKQYGKVHPRVSDTYFNIGSLHLQNQEYKKAIHFFESAIAIDRQQEESQGKKLAHRLTSLSEAYFLTNRRDLAIKYGYQAIEYYEKTTINPAYSATAYQNLGTLYQSEKNYEQALSLYQKGLSQLSEEPLDSITWSNPKVEIWNVSERFHQILNEKMTTLDAWNTAAPSKFKLEMALNTAESLIQTITLIQKNIAEKNSKFLFLKDSRLIFEKALGYCFQLFEQTTDAAYLEKAFTIYEQSKSVLLRNVLQNERAKSIGEIPDSLRQNVATIKQDLDELAFQLKNATTKEEKEQGQKALFDKKERYANILNDLEKDFPKYYQVKNELEAFNLDVFQKKVAINQETIFAWFVGETNLYFFKITPDHVDFKQIKKKDSFDESILLFSKMLNDNALASNKGNALSLFNDFIQQSSNLYEALFPLGTPINGSIVLIPDGLLTLIPIELLLTEQSKNQVEVDYASLPYILKKSTIRYAYAPSLLLIPAEKQATQKDQLLAFSPIYQNDAEGVFASRSELSALKYAQLEVKNINDLLDSKNMIGQMATEDNFKKLANQHRLLHLAMHASIDNENPSFSGLKFSDNPNGGEDATLYAYEIANMKLSAELVVLSACNTGSGKLITSEGPISLARAFRKAGCPNIVMSLWQADDEATAALMDVFYKNLKAGKGKAEALRQAKLTYLEKGRKTFPHYWAAFVLTGDDEGVNFTKYNNWWIGFVGIFLLVLGVFGWRWRGV